MSSSKINGFRAPTPTGILPLKNAIIWRERDPGTFHAFLVEGGEEQLLGLVSYVVPRVQAPGNAPGWEWVFLDTLRQRGAPSCAERFTYREQAQAEFVTHLVAYLYSVAPKDREGM